MYSKARRRDVAPKIGHEQSPTNVPLQTSGYAMMAPTSYSSGIAHGYYGQQQQQQQTVYAHPPDMYHHDRRHTVVGTDGAVMGQGAKGSSPGTMSRRDWIYEQRKQQRLSPRSEEDVQQQPQYAADVSEGQFLSGRTAEGDYGWRNHGDMARHAPPPSLFQVPSNEDMTRRPLLSNEFSSPQSYGGGPLVESSLRISKQYSPPFRNDHPSVESGGARFAAVSSSSPQRQQQGYLADLQKQLVDKEQEKKLARQRKIEDERRDLDVMNSYNPWGRPGAGAPLRDADGRIVTNRRPEQGPLSVQGNGFSPNGRSPSGAYGYVGGNVSSEPRVVSAQPQTHHTRYASVPASMASGREGYSPTKDATSSQWQSQFGYGSPPAGQEALPPQPQFGFSPKGGGAGGAGEGAPGSGGTYGRFKWSNRLPYEQEERMRKLREQQAVQQALKEQMEERQRQKALEQQRRKEMERREEERIRRDAEEMERRYRMEQQHGAAKGGVSHVAGSSPGQAPVPAVVSVVPPVSEPAPSFGRRSHRQASNSNTSVPPPILAPDPSSMTDFELERIRKGLQAGQRLSPPRTREPEDPPPVSSNNGPVRLSHERTPSQSVDSRAMQSPPYIPPPATHCAPSPVVAPVLSPPVGYRRARSGPVSPSGTGRMPNPGDEALFLQTRVQIEALRDEFRQEKDELLRLLENQQRALLANQPRLQGNRQDDVERMLHALRREIAEKEVRDREEIDQLRRELEERKRQEREGLQMAIAGQAYGGADSLDRLTSSAAGGVIPGDDRSASSMSIGVDRISALNDDRLTRLSYISSKLNNDSIGADDAIDAVLRDFAASKRRPGQGGAYGVGTASGQKSPYADLDAESRFLS